MKNSEPHPAIIPHCWFPLTAAVKAREDKIPLFGWKDDGWPDMTNAPVTNHSGVAAGEGEPGQDGTGGFVLISWDIEEET